jgi:hypothetical protein
MNPELAFFEWFRCPKGYRIANARDVARVARRRHAEIYPDEEWIVANSDERVMYRCPMDHTASLVTVFAPVNTPEKLLRFVKQYGPMVRHVSCKWGDSIPECLRRAQRVRELLRCKEQGPKKVAALYRAQMHALYVKEARRALPTGSEGSISFDHIGIIDLVPDSARGVRLRLTADSLIGAMVWQLGLKLSGATGFRECRQCGIPFEAGAGTDLRADSTFCCAEHSVLFHSRRRRKEFKNA